MSTFDPANITPDQQLHIAIGATIAAGPDGTNLDIAHKAEQILRVLRESGPLASIMYSEAARAERIDKVKRFTGTLLWVDKETSSGRGLIFLYTDSDKARHTTDGQEFVRTGILDSTPEAKQLVITASSQLIGHRVSVAVELEKGTNGHAFRVLADMRDLGPDPDYDATNPTYQLSPAFDDPHRSGQKQPLLPKLVNCDYAPLRTT